MKRTYRKPRLLYPAKPGQIAFAFFLVFIAYKILTPPSDEAARVDSPDGSKTARLRRIHYYANQPSYKIDYRATGKKGWLSLYHLPAYTNAPAESVRAEIAWSPGSDRLDLLMNGSSVWHHAFE